MITKKEIIKLIKKYNDEINNQYKNALIDPIFKDECFYRCTQLHFVIKDLEKIASI